MPALTLPEKNGDRAIENSISLDKSKPSSQSIEQEEPELKIEQSTAEFILSLWAVFLELCLQIWKKLHVYLKLMHSSQTAFSCCYSFITINAMHIYVFCWSANVTCIHTYTYRSIGRKTTKNINTIMLIIRKYSLSRQIPLFWDQLQTNVKSNSAEIIPPNFIVKDLVMPLLTIKCSTEQRQVGAQSRRIGG